MKPHPILSSLRHHKLTAFLLMLQVALTFAIVCNVVYLVVERVTVVNKPSGLDERGLSIVSVQSIDKADNVIARHDTDLAALRAIPGVSNAVAVDSLPYSGSMAMYGVCATLDDMRRAMVVQSMDQQQGCSQPAVYSGTAGEIATLGVHLVEGRDFNVNEYVVDDKDVAAAIVTRDLAQKLYPGQQALGQSLYMGSFKPVRIVGIVDRFVQPSPRGTAADQISMVWPKKPSAPYVMYVMRSAPAERQRILKAAAAKLMQLYPERIIDPGEIRTFADMRQRFFQRDVTMIGLLIASCLGLLFVTALGISGLANFWVQQRRKQIGIRRAIGATRSDVLRYFQTENFLIVSGGILVGVLLTIALNLLLMQQYELPRLPPFYLLIGAVALWLLGQLAVLGPALRAAAVPPVVATRSV